MSNAAIAQQFPGTRGARWAISMLGALLLAQGLGKLIDPAGYVSALGAFDLVPAGGLWPVAVAWLITEIAAGAGLLYAGLATDPQRQVSRASAVLGVLTAVAYATLTTQAYTRGLSVDNCTCFGVYLAQKLSWFVLLQDAYMLVYTGYVLRKTWRWLPLPVARSAEAPALPA